MGSASPPDRHRACHAGRLSTRAKTAEAGELAPAGKRVDGAPELAYPVIGLEGKYGIRREQKVGRRLAGNSVQPAFRCGRREDVR